MARTSPSTRPLDGGAPTTLASGVACDSVAVGSSAVYTLGNDMLVAAPLDGGATQVLELNSGDGIAVDSTSVYWIGSPDGRVLKAGLDGGTLTTLASSGLCFFPVALAIDTTNVYWADQEQGTISKAALDGGSVTTLASGLGLISGLAIDATRACPYIRSQRRAQPMVTTAA
jgi:hypothetical protein